MSNFYTELHKKKILNLYKNSPIYGNNTRYNFCFKENGIKHIDEVYAEDLITELAPTTVLDYGCGNGLASAQLQTVFPNIKFFNYEPFVTEFSTKPTGKYDLVICHKVLRSVELCFIDNVLADLYNLSTNYIALSLVICEEDELNLCDWIEKLSNYNIIKRGFTVPFYATGADMIHHSMIHAGFLIKK
jgi:2-polyprenyl-3-methyl-5-hydroxy-6-metoxy-1,4-benzoquinol methylase